MCTKLEAATLSGDQVPPFICGYVGNGIQDGLKNHCFAHAGSNPATHTTIKMGWFFTNDSTPEELFTDETMIGVYNEFINEMLHNRENADIEKSLRETLLRYGA